MAIDDPKTLVSTDWLDTHLKDPDLRVLDGTWFLPNEINPVREKKELLSRGVADRRVFFLEHDPRGAGVQVRGEGSGFQVDQWVAL